MKVLRLLIYLLLGATIGAMVSYEIHVVYDLNYGVHLYEVNRNHKLERLQKSVYALFIEGESGMGTAVVISDHFVLTAQHVIDPFVPGMKIGLVEIKLADGLTVYNLKSKKEHIRGGEVVLYNERMDVALIYFKDHTFKHHLKFRLNKLPAPHAKILHLGYPPTTGPISPHGEVLKYYMFNGHLRLNAHLDIIPGSSGGAITDKYGRFIAMSQTHTRGLGNPSFASGATSHSIYVWLRGRGFGYLIDY